jgi:DNA mismatch repair protein MutL
MGHITEQVTRIALAYPAVHLAVTHGGRSVYELPGTDSVRDRVAAFFGADLARSLIEIESEEPAGRLWGLVGTPQASRATAAAQYLFINGRYVRDRGLLHALREAYRGLLEGSRQPVAFLFLSVPPDRVDVNVHPTKIEVRLRDAHLLYGQVLAGVRERMLGPGITPHLAPPEEAPGISEAAAPSEAWPPETSQAQAPAGRDSEIKQAVADFLRSPQAASQGQFHLQGRPPAERLGPAAPGAGEALPISAPPPPTGRAAAFEPAAETRAIQIHNTYLVAETADGILIVDQHALHERVLFEEIMRRLAAGPLESQRRLVPITVDLADREMAAVEAHRDALARLGIDAEPIGPRTVGIHGFPLLLEKADPAGTLRDFVAWALACERPPDVRQVLEQLAHVAACRGAVKAGDPLKAEEMAALLAHREAARMAATCPHGRPTALLLKKTDLEKQFGRDYAAPSPKPTDESLPF